MKGRQVEVTGSTSEKGTLVYGLEGSTVQRNKECDKEVRKRVQAGWNRSRKVSANVYKRAVRPAILFGLETLALTKRQEAELEEGELKMIRFSLGMTSMDKIRNEHIRGTAKVRQFRDKVREARLR